MPKLPNFKLSLPTPHLKLGIGGRPGGDVVGLDIQPGFVAAVKANVNGSIVADRAACLPLASDIVREGEVADVAALSEVLRELFVGTRLSKRVRVGIANQRTVMRTLELPPVTDRKELAAAVQFQAQDQVPMPLSNAVLDFHPMGVVDTPSGPRQHVVLVAAQRDMVEHLLAAVRGAGLQPEGVDLSAFALIRSLYQAEPNSDSDAGSSRVVYLNVDGLTNLAIAEGTICRFTRVVGGGLEGMAGELAERRSMPLTDARAMLAAVDLTVPLVAPGHRVAPAEPDAADAAAAAWSSPEPAAPQADTPLDASPQTVAPEESSEASPYEDSAPEADSQPAAAAEEPAEDVALPALAAEESEAAEDGDGDGDEVVFQLDTPVSPEDHDAEEHAMSFSEMSSSGTQVPPAEVPEEPEYEHRTSDADAEARTVLENGIREIAGEVRNSLDFHRSQEGGGEISHVVLSGSVLDLPGFAEALQGHLGLEVHTESVHASANAPAGVSMHRLAVAAGLTTLEVHR
jgi:type IV pilus assembly protein PilM